MCGRVWVGACECTIEKIPTLQQCIGLLSVTTYHYVVLCHIQIPRSLLNLLSDSFFLYIAQHGSTVWSVGHKISLETAVKLVLSCSIKRVTGVVVGIVLCMG